MGAAKCGASRGGCIVALNKHRGGNFVSGVDAGLAGKNSWDEYLENVISSYQMSMLFIPTSYGRVLGLQEAASASCVKSFQNVMFSFLKHAINQPVLHLSNNL